MCEMKRSVEIRLKEIGNEIVGNYDELEML